jgi:hypothetical protein
VVRLPAAAEDTVVTIRRVSILADAKTELAEFKKTCLRAIGEKCLLFLSAG